MKRGLIAEPADLIGLCVEMFSIQWNDACSIIDWVRPEAECRTYTYELDEVQEELDGMIADGTDPTDNYFRAYQALAEFMRQHGVTEFVLTQ